MKIYRWEERLTLILLILVLNGLVFMDASLLTILFCFAVYAGALVSYAAKIKWLKT